MDPAACTPHRPPPVPVPASPLMHESGALLRYALPRPCLSSWSFRAAAAGAAAAAGDARAYPPPSSHLVSPPHRSPSFAASFVELKTKVTGGSAVKVSARSTLVLDGDIELRALDLDGTLIIKAAPGAKVVVDGLSVKNAGWEWVALEDMPAGYAAPEEETIRGFTVRKAEAEVAEFNEPGQFSLPS